MHVYCSHVTCIYVHQYTSQYGYMVSGMVEMCALIHMYSPIGFVPHSMQADPKTILSHDQMMQDYPRFSENLKRELTEEEKAKFIVSIIFVYVIVRQCILYCISLKIKNFVM